MSENGGVSMRRNAQIPQSSGSQLIDQKHNYPGGGTGAASFVSVLPDKLDSSNLSCNSAQAQVIRMWEGGPLRYWSLSKTTKTTSTYAQGCFAGSYVCDQCLESCDGVYELREEQRWLCGACKRGTGPSAKQSTSNPKMSCGHSTIHSFARRSP